MPILIGQAALSSCLKRNADCFFIDALWQPSGFADCEGAGENAFGVIDNPLKAGITSEWKMGLDCILICLICCMTTK